MIPGFFDTQLLARRMSATLLVWDSVVYCGPISSNSMSCTSHTDAGPQYLSKGSKILKPYVRSSIVQSSR